MKKIIFTLTVVITAALLLISCDALEKMTYTDIEGCDLYFEVEAISGQSRADATAFSASRTINMQDQEFVDDLEDVTSVAKLIKAIKANKVSMTLSSDSGTKVLGLTVIAKIDDVTIASFGPADYTFGVSNPLDLTAFGKPMLNDFVKNKNISITVAGSSDVPAGQKITFEFLFEEVVITAGLNL